MSIITLSGSLLLTFDQELTGYGPVTLTIGGAITGTGFYSVEAGITGFMTPTGLSFSTTNSFDVGFVTITDGGEWQTPSFGRLSPAPFFFG